MSRDNGTALALGQVSSAAEARGHQVRGRVWGLRCGKGGARIKKETSVGVWERKRDRR